MEYNNKLCIPGSVYALKVTALLYCLKMSAVHSPLVGT